MKTKTKKISKTAKATIPSPVVKKPGRPFNPDTIVTRLGTEEYHINSVQPNITGERLKAQVIKDESVILNKDFAKWYIGLPTFEGERTVVEGHVQNLYDVMQQGTFNPNLVTISTAVLKGRTYRINGQHTCWAVLTTKNAEYTVRHVQYRVSNIEQLRLLYSTHDRLLPRTDAHLVKIQLVHTAEMDGIAPSTIQRLVPGLRLWMNERAMDQRRCNPQAIAAAVRGPHNATFRKVAEYYAKHVSTFTEIKRQAILAAMFATFNVAPTKAPEFWDPVVTGLNLGAKTDARWALRDVIMKSCIQQKGSGKGRRQLGTEDLYRITILLWNKWREGGGVHSAPRATNTRMKAK